MSVAQAILETARAELARHGLNGLLAVRVRLGRLSGVVPESLSFCWKILTEAGPAQGARLDLDLVEILARCQDCGQEFGPEESVFLCPGCGSGRVEILRGRELIVESLEGE